MATNYTDKLQQDYPKAWEAFRVWYKKELGGETDLDEEDYNTRIDVELCMLANGSYLWWQGVLEAFGRSRDLYIEYMRLETKEHDFDLYKGFLRIVNFCSTDHEQAHKAAVTAMFQQIEKELEK